MDSFTLFPAAPITENGIVSKAFLHRDVKTFIEACRFVHRMPYGYNSDRDDMMTLFTEEKGSCTTKHAVIGTLAAELDLPVRKSIGIYAMTEAIVTGADRILGKYHLPYVPMIHCFLVYDRYRVDLTEGNRNGKNRSIETFLHTEPVTPNISGRDEYFRYRKALTGVILVRKELKGSDIKTVLHARAEGLALLKANIGES